MKYAPLPMFTAEEVVRAIAGDDDVLAAQALFSVAGCGMPRAQAERILLDAAKESRVGRRRAAAVGLGYFAQAQGYASPALVEMLQSVKARDPDGETRGNAEMALDDIELLGR